MEKEIEKIQFELKDNELDSTKERESKEVPHTLILRRSIHEKQKLGIYTPLIFYFDFPLSIINNDPRTIRDTMHLQNGKFQKKAIIEEMAYLHKNEAWNIMEFLAKINLTCNKWMFKKKLNVEGRVEKYKA